MAEKRDYYEVLGVKKDATAEEIKKAYRKVTKENHPDLHPGDKACEERFKEANEAYEVLSDEEKRKKYDQYGHAAFDPNEGFGGGFGGFGGGFGDFSDIFSSFGDIFGFGGGSQTRNPNAPRRGDNVRAQLNISFEEAAFGCEKELNIPRIEPCTDCNGTGCAPGTTPEVCPDCGGSGQVRTTQRTPFGMAQTMSPCSKCRGTGKIIHQPCKTCRGMGNVRRAKKMTVKVPAGIDDGQTISRQGYGNAGANGGPAGDLLISVIVRPHAIFERDGTGGRGPDFGRKSQADHPRRNTAGRGVPSARKGNPVSARQRQGGPVRFGEHYGPEEPQQPPEGSAAGVRRHHGRGTCQVRHLRQEETLSEGHRFHHIKKPFGIPVQDPEGLVCFYDRTDQKRQSL